MVIINYYGLKIGVPENGTPIWIKNKVDDLKCQVANLERTVGAAHASGRLKIPELSGMGVVVIDNNKTELGFDFVKIPDEYMWTKGEVLGGFHGRDWTYVWMNI